MSLSTPSNQPEYPPIFEIGRHIINAKELRALCVNNFPSSYTRPQIMDGLEKILTKIINADIKGEIWVNGSFVTKKINPNDVDLVLRISAELYENGNDTLRETLDWLSSNLKGSHLCDSYCFMEWPEGHKNYWIGQYMHTYWMRQFGFSRGNQMKGIPVLNIPGALS